MEWDSQQKTHFEQGEVRGGGPEQEV